MFLAIFFFSCTPSDVQKIYSHRDEIMKQIGGTSFFIKSYYINYKTHKDTLENNFFIFKKNDSISLYRDEIMYNTQMSGFHAEYGSDLYKREVERKISDILAVMDKYDVREYSYNFYSVNDIVMHMKSGRVILFIPQMEDSSPLFNDIVLTRYNKIDANWYYAKGYVSPGIFKIKHLQ